MGGMLLVGRWYVIGEWRWYVIGGWGWYVIGGWGWYVVGGWGWYVIGIGLVGKWVAYDWWVVCD